MNNYLKKTIEACSLNGIMFGLIKLFYESVPEPMSGLLYCTFLGFTVTFAVGGQAKEFGNYLLSIGMGLIWTGGYLGFEAALIWLPFSADSSKAIAFGLMSFVIEFMNVLLLNKTPFRFIPLQFAVVIGVFSQQCQHIPFVLFALLLGVITALCSKTIYRVFLEKPEAR